MHYSQCLRRHSVLSPSVQQPSVPLLVAARSAWSPLGLKKNLFLSIPLRLPLCPLPAPLRNFPSLLQHPAVSHLSPMGSPPLLIPTRASPAPGTGPRMWQTTAFPLQPRWGCLSMQNIQQHRQKAEIPLALGLLCDKGQMISL